MTATFQTSEERQMNHFNTHNNGCRLRRESKPQIQHEPGCTWIECDASRCPCAMADGGDLSTSAFLAKWQGRYGR